MNQKKSKNGRSYFIVFYVLLALVFIVALFIAFYEGRAVFSPNVADVSFDVGEGYIIGDKLAGRLDFSFRRGEDLSTDSKVVIYLGGLQREYSVADLTGVLTSEKLASLDEGVLSFNLLIYDSSGFSRKGITGRAVDLEGFGMSSSSIKDYSLLEESPPYRSSDVLSSENSDLLPKVPDLSGKDVEEPQRQTQIGASGGGSSNVEEFSVSESPELSNESSDESIMQVAEEPTLFFDENFGFIEEDVVSFNELIDVGESFIAPLFLTSDENVVVVGDVFYDGQRISSDSLNIRKNWDNSVSVSFTPKVIDAYSSGERVTMDLKTTDISLFEDTVIGLRLISPEGEILASFEKLIDIEESFKKQFSARVGEPVTWVERKPANYGAKNVAFEIPESAAQVSFNLIKRATGEKSDGFENSQRTLQKLKIDKTERIRGLYGDKSKGLSITGSAISDFEYLKTKTVSADISGDSDLYEVRYVTPAPVISSDVMVAENKRKVSISGPSDVHYDNVLIYVPIPVSWKIMSPEKLSVYWVEGEQLIEPSVYFGKEGFANKIEWTAPRLSNQTFEIIIRFAGAERLDSARNFVSDIYENVSSLDGAWSDVLEGEYLRLSFNSNLANGDTISLYARSVQGSDAKVYVLQEDELVQVGDFGRLFDWRVYDSNLSNLEEISSVFYVQFLESDVEIDYVYDSVGLSESPEITFTNSTPADLSVLIDNSFEIGLNGLSVNDFYSLLNLDSDVLFWMRFDDYNESVIRDVGGYDYSGVLTGVVELGEGVWGEDLELNGGGYVEINSTNFIVPTEEFSVSGWMRLNDFSKESSALSYGNESHELINYGYNFEENQFVFSVDGEFVYSNFSIDSEWHHVVGVYGLDGMKIYVDGLLSGIVDYPGQLNLDNSSDLRVGGFNDSRFYGGLDELLIFNRALSELEILALFGSGDYFREFDDLSYGMHMFRGFAVDKFAFVGWTEERQILIDSLPNVELISPSDDSLVYSPLPAFLWSGNDFDENELFYDLKVDFVGSDCSDEERIVEGIVGEGYAFVDPMAPLACSGNGSFYEWSVRAFDGYHYGSWSDPLEFELFAPILSPAPNYIEFSANSVDVGEDVQFYLRISNEGGETDSVVSSRIGIYDSLGNEVQLLDLGEEIIHPLSFVESRIDVSTVGFSAGEYKAIAIVDFSDSEELRAEVSFKLGGLYVGISNYKKVFDKRRVNDLFVEVESYWNDQISEVYAVIDIVGYGESYQTPSVVLPPKGTSILERGIDLSYVQEESVSVDITVYYDGQKTTERVILVLDDGFDFILIGLIVLSIMACGVVVYLVWSYVRSNKKRRKLF